MGNDSIIRHTERAFDSRTVHITFQYNFGQAPRVRQRPQEPQQQGGSRFGG